MNCFMVFFIRLIHITIFLLMSSWTLYGNFYLYNKEEIAVSWHCRLLNYFMSMFASGIYGSCFFQSLFRFWRVIKSDQILYRKFSFHFWLIVSNWLFILILSLPVWFRSIYVSSENFFLIVLVIDGHRVVSPWKKIAAIRISVKSLP